MFEGKIQKTIPVSVLEHEIASLEADADAIARRLGDQWAQPTRLQAIQLRKLVQDPENRWVSPADAAALKGCHEETIRRHCRNGTAAFEFEKEMNGHYRIWLPTFVSEETA
jgi:hypothetical protein